MSSITKLGLTAVLASVALGSSMSSPNDDEIQEHLEILEDYYGEVDFFEEGEEGEGGDDRRLSALSGTDIDGFLGERDLDEERDLNGKLFGQG